MHFPERTAVDLDLLHSFVSVVDAGGFTRAGERVHRTQSTVSQQIRKLEDALGCALFIREGRGVRLTEDGERLLGYARRMLALSTKSARWSAASGGWRSCGWACPTTWRSPG